MSELRICECDRCRENPDNAVEYGKCHCRCGNRTRVPNNTRLQYNIIKGVPMAFCLGHNNALRVKVIPAPPPQGAKCTCVQCKANPKLAVEYGKCHCTCGNDAPIASKTNNGRGSVKGQPVKFISGHSSHVVDYQCSRWKLPTANKLAELYRQGMTQDEFGQWLAELNSKRNPVSRGTVRKIERSLGITRDRSYVQLISYRKYPDRAKTAKANIQKAIESCRGKSATPKQRASLKLGVKRAAELRKSQRIHLVCAAPLCTHSVDYPPYRYRQLKVHPYMCRRHAIPFAKHEQKVANLKVKLDKFVSECLDKTKRRIDFPKPDWVTDEEWAKLTASE